MTSSEWLRRVLLSYKVDYKIKITSVASKGRIHYTLIVANQYAVLKLTD